MISGDTPLLVEDFKDWQSFFSRREQAFLEPFLLCPLFHENRPSGILIIAESPLLSLGDPAEVLKGIPAAVGTFLYRSRQKTIDKLPGSDVQVCDSESLKDFIRNLRDKDHRAVFIRIDPSLYLQSLNLDTDLYRVHEDITLILSSMVSGSGTTCRTDSGNLLMVLEASRHLDGELIKHHILTSLSSFLSIPPDSSSFSPSVSVCPDDIEDIDEAVDTFLRD